MEVKTTRELDHFIRYLIDFLGINVNNKTYLQSEDKWVVYLTDGAAYEISDQYWGIVQENISRLRFNKAVAQ